MRWPTPSDYQDAVQNPAHCFSDPRLRAARPALGPLGLPKVASGNYCSVYQMRLGASRWAVRCFNRQVPDAERRYRTIDQHLERHRHLPWFVGFDFITDGIRIHSRWYPIVTMDWVEGATLSRYLEENVREGVSLRTLADQWTRLIADLRAAQIAHGDLQHGNVLVAGDDLRLVDYDNLWVPAFQGEPSPELGRLHYQHPRRTADDFDLEIGNFAALVIYLSLRALAVDPSLWRFHNGENLILTADDYKHPAASPALAQMRKSPDLLVPRLAAELARCAALPVDQVPALEAVIASLGVAVPPGASTLPSASRPPGRTASGAPDWLGPSTPASPSTPSQPPRRPTPAISPSPPSRARLPAPAPPPGDPWWDETPPPAAPAPVPPTPGRPARRRPGWLPSSRSSSMRQPGAGAGTIVSPSRPAVPAVSPAGCVAALLRSCLLVGMLALLLLAGAGYWVYQNWQEIGPFVTLPPITVPDGGTGDVPPPAERPPADEAPARPERPEPRGPDVGGAGVPDTEPQHTEARSPSPPGPPGRIPTPRPDRKRAPDPELSSARALAFLDDAIGQLQAGTPAAALDALERARQAGLPLDDRETARRFYSALAEARYRVGRYAESLPAFTRALALAPDNQRLRHLYADAQERAR